MTYNIKDQRSRALSTSIYLVIRTYFNKNYGDWTIKNKVLRHMANFRHIALRV